MEKKILSDTVPANPHTGNPLLNLFSLKYLIIRF